MIILLRLLLFFFNGFNCSIITLILLMEERTVKRREEEHSFFEVWQNRFLLLVKQSKTLFTQGSPFSFNAGLHRAGHCILKKLIYIKNFHQILHLKSLIKIQ